VVAVVGPTASGKSAVAHEVARRLGRAEIVTVDSMQVYRGMDIGTAKPGPVERAEVPHHLLDVVDPGDEYDVTRFAADVAVALREIAGRSAAAVLVGGTGLYLRAALGEIEAPGQFPDVRAALDAEPDTAVLHRRLVQLDPVAAGRMEPSNRRRVLRALEVCVGSGRPFSSYGPGLAVYPPTPVRLFGLRPTRPALDRRIVRRYREQLAAGFLDEVRTLAAGPRPLSRTAGQALGYRELLEHLAGATALEEAVDRAIVRTRQFARRQERWFRRDPRIRWIDLPGDDPRPEDAVPVILDALAG
jgi:tRNA dimethylallyltransferase